MDDIVTIDSEWDLVQLLETLKRELKGMETLL